MYLLPKKGKLQSRRVPVCDVPIRCCDFIRLYVLRRIHSPSLCFFIFFTRIEYADTLQTSFVFFDSLSGWMNSTHGDRKNGAKTRSAIFEHFHFWRREEQRQQRNIRCSVRTASEFVNSIQRPQLIACWEIAQNVFSSQVLNVIFSPRFSNLECKKIY